MTDTAPQLPLGIRLFRLIYPGQMMSLTMAAMGNPAMASEDLTFPGIEGDQVTLPRWSMAIAHLHEAVAERADCRFNLVTARPVGDGEGARPERPARRLPPRKEHSPIAQVCYSDSPRPVVLASRPGSPVPPFRLELTLHYTNLLVFTAVAAENYEVEYPPYEPAEPGGVVDYAVADETGEPPRGTTSVFTFASV